MIMIQSDNADLGYNLQIFYVFMFQICCYLQAYSVREHDFPEWCFAASWLFKYSEKKPMMSLFTYLTRTPPTPPIHSHLLVSLPFAAVRIKLYIMAAIKSLASWLLLTPNQHSCFLVMFIAIVGQIVCFENAKSNSPDVKERASDWLPVFPRLIWI